jgi:hypothetical protein
MCLVLELLISYALLPDGFAILDICSLILFHLLLFGAFGIIGIALCLTEKLG